MSRVLCGSRYWIWICNSLQIGTLSTTRDLLLLLFQFTWRDFIIILLLNRRKTERKMANEKKNMANYEFLMNAHLIHDIAFVPNLVHIAAEIERPRAVAAICYILPYSGLESNVCSTSSQSFKLYNTFLCVLV